MTIGGNLWRVAAAAAAGVALVLALWIFGVPIIGGGLLAKVGKLTALNAVNVANHRQTKANFTAATAEALRLEKARLTRVRAEQERINADAEASFNRRVADLRARYDSLREQSRTGAAGAGDGNAVPDLRDAAGGTYAQASADGFSLAERLEASIYATQLDELITAIERQVAINPNSE